MYVRGSNTSFDRTLMLLINHEEERSDEREINPKINGRTLTVGYEGKNITKDINVK